MTTTLRYIILTSLFFCIYTLSFGQNTTESIETDELFSDNATFLKNEIKINLAYVPFGYIEAAYERILPSNTSIGLSLGAALEADIEINYHALAFFRLFFGSTKGKGFFIEADAVYWQEERSPRTGSVTGPGYGVGLAAGGKFFRMKGWHGELVLGIGRTIENNDNYLEGSYPRLAIAIGKRF